MRYLTKTLRDTFPFSEVAIKIVLRAKGEGGSRRDDESTVEMAAVSESEEDLPPIVRKSGKHKAPREELDEQDTHAAEPPPTPKLRPRKKPGAETWEF